MCTVKPMYTRYKLVTENKNWTAAQLHCQAQHRAKLVVIDSMKELLALKAYIDTIDGLCACTHFCYTISLSLSVKAL